MRNHTHGCEETHASRLFLSDTPRDISTCPHGDDPDIREFRIVVLRNRERLILEYDILFCLRLSIEWCTIRSEESIETSDFVFFWEYLSTHALPPTRSLLSHPPLSDDLGCDRGWEDAARTVGTFLRILRVWSRVWSEEYFFISRVYELLYREEIFWVFQSWFTVKVWIKCMPSLLIMGCTEKVLWRHTSPEIRIFSWLHEFRHLLRGYMFDDDLEIWMIHRDALYEGKKLTFRTMHESFRNMSVTTACHGRFGVERKDDSCFRDRSQYFTRSRIFGVDIARRCSWIRRDTSRVVFHSADMTPTRIDRLRSRLRLQWYRHERSRSLWKILFEFCTIILDFRTIYYMIR